MLSLAADVAAIVGLVTVVFLLGSLRLERRRRVQIDPEWRITAERERLSGAAIWKGYKR